MSNLNPYAEKVFAEHPLALWALDEEVSYISLISEEDRNFAAWTVTNGTTTIASSIESPFQDSVTNSVSISLVDESIPDDPSDPTTHTTALISPIILNDESEIDSSKKTISIGLYGKGLASSDTKFMFVGYSYINPSTLNTVEVLNKINYDYQLVGNSWEFISETIELPIAFKDFRLVIKHTHIPPSSYSEFLINGISLGQWSEEFHAESLGISGTTISNNSIFDGQKAITLDAYGINDNNGYYLINNSNKLLSKNHGIPMVFGSSNVTKIVLDSNQESIIFPGHGMLNEIGKYREYTFEAWIKINTFKYGSNKIWGPVSSSDGLYIDGAFLRLEIGGIVGSHFLSEINRPMLLNIKIFETGASLLINSEEVISLDIDIPSINFPSKYNNQNKDQDWIAFYSNSDVQLEIDCVSIYSYLVPSIVLKRRFAYGQAVEFPENSNTFYGGSSVAIDYESSEYSNSYSYPAIGKWEQGILENMLSDKNKLSVPKYSLPEINFKQDKTLQEWEAYLYNKQINLENNPKKKYLEFDEYINHLYFDSLNILLEDVKAMYGIFGINQYSNNEQILIKLENKINKNNFVVSIQNDILYYRFVTATGSTTIREEYILNGSDLFIGLEFDAISREFGSQIKEFFGNKSQIGVYVGGYKDLTANSFTGKIYKIAFSTNNNFQEIKSQFPTTYESLPDNSVVEFDAGDEYFGNDPSIWTFILDGGSVSSFSSTINPELLLNHVASYTLIPKFFATSMSIDIACSSYWEDYVPLSYFGRYALDEFNNRSYELDFLQFNIGYPYINNISQNSEYNTQTTSVKTYVTFQYLSNGSNAKYSYFINTETPNNGVIVPESNWLTTKYEVVDGTIIYPPVGVAFEDLSITTHIEFMVSGILKSPLEIRNLQFASQSLDSSGANKIGTKFGIDIYPYVKFGYYFDYKSRNPLKIYRGKAPYLYLTNNSGIELVGDFSSSSRGISIPINTKLNPEYSISAVQAFAKFSGTEFSQDAVEVFDFNSKNRKVKIFMQANDSLGIRAALYAIDYSAGQEPRKTGFYLNGILVKEPVININEWFALGINFSSFLNFDSYSGAIRITGPLMVNNLSYYKVSNIDSFGYRRDPITGIFYKDSDLPFVRDNQALVVPDFGQSEPHFKTNPISFVPNAKNTYKIYTGTQNIVIDDSSGISVQDYQYSIYKELLWQRQVTKPV